MQGADAGNPLRVVEAGRAQQISQRKALSGQKNGKLKLLKGIARQIVFC